MDAWNSLQINNVNSYNTDIFKRRLDAYWYDQYIIYIIFVLKEPEVVVEYLDMSNSL